MPLSGQAVLLRIYTDEEALAGAQRLYTAVVRRARAAGLAGVTVLRGRVGFGEAARVHAHEPFDLKDNLPMVIEIVDHEDAARRFADSLADLRHIGLVTIEKIEVLRYGGHHVEPHR